MDNDLGWLVSFMDKSPDPPVVEILVTVPVKSGPSFTVRDWEMLVTLSSLNAAGNFKPTNSTVGQALGMTNGAVSARIKRLTTMGLLYVEHHNATDTGKNNERVVKVLGIPPKPWSPE